MKFDVIYADPPWSYSDKHVGGYRNSGAVDKYPVLDIEELCKLPVQDISENNSVLFLWVTVPLLLDGIKVLESWGFKYKTMLTWNKTRCFGMGAWFRGNTEHILVGVRGKVKPFKVQKRNIIDHPRLKHSQKPEDFRQLIDIGAANAFNAPKKLEMFARQSPAGWTVAGNEIDNKDIRDAIEDLKKL